MLKDKLSAAAVVSVFLAIIRRALYSAVACNKYLYCYFRCVNTPSIKAFNFPTVLYLGFNHNYVLLFQSYSNEL